MNNEQKKFLSTSELAYLLKVSRILIFKKIQAGEIQAIKVGRNYIIPIEEYMTLSGSHVSEEKKADIRKIVRKVVSQYGEALRLLGKE